MGEAEYKNFGWTCACGHPWAAEDTDIGRSIALGIVADTSMLNTARQTGQQLGPLPGVAQAQSIMQAATSGLGVPKPPANLSAGEFDDVLEQAGKGHPKRSIESDFQHRAGEHERKAKSAKGTKDYSKGKQGTTGKTPTQPHVGKGPEMDWSSFFEQDQKWRNFETASQYYGSGEPKAPSMGGPPFQGMHAGGYSGAAPTLQSSSTSSSRDASSEVSSSDPSLGTLVQRAEDYVSTLRASEPGTASSATNAAATGQVQAAKSWADTSLHNVIEAISGAVFRQPWSEVAPTPMQVRGILESQLPPSHLSSPSPAIPATPPPQQSGTGVYGARTSEPSV